MNIVIDAPTHIDHLIKITSYKYHPYGMEEFRENILSHIDECRTKGLSYTGHDNLTHAWRTPWDYHLRQRELMSPLTDMVMKLVNDIDPDWNWYLRESWISEYINLSAANKHCHYFGDSKGWSYCYYVEVPDEGPGFTVFDDGDNCMSSLGVTTGDLLIFSTSLQHQVFPSLSKRVIISGNFSVADYKHLDQSLCYNENFLKESYYCGVEHERKFDPDNWDKSVTDQMLQIKEDS